jgi:putative ABC transport system permease protein
VVGISWMRTEKWQQGVGMSVGIAVVVGVLVASASALSWLARRLVRRGWPYVVRQGVANLYRPANQTRAVVLALGFGAFLVSTLYLLQNSLLAQFRVTAASSQGNLLFFDVQDDQAPPLAAIVTSAGHQVIQRVPIVTMRIASINNTPVNTLVARRRGASWAYRREYRSTYRDTLVQSEKLVAGKWFGTPAAGDTIAEMSLERDLVRDMGLKLGDVITWDVQGVKVPTRLTSSREVNWSRFEPNFFAVFQPAALEDAPKQFVILASVPRAQVPVLQRTAVQRFPNVSSIDLSLILETVMKIIDRVSLAVRFMAVFSLAMGVPVLFSAVAATRRARVREGVLLKTLGATRSQIGRILLAEYALLGVLGSLTGMILSFGGAWALSKWVFETPFAPAWGPAFGIAGAMLALTVGIGLMAGRDVFRETPMAALREA